MTNELNMYEEKGIKEVNNKKWVWETLLACNDLYYVIANNIGDIPNIPYTDLYMLLNTLLQIKSAMYELIGRSEK